MENTVFVRFEPTPQHKVMRHELEDIFSQAGPIKKSSWINTKGAVAPSGDGENYQRGTAARSSKGYGFIKYLAQEDAVAAQKDLNNSKIQMDGKTYTLKVELASVSAAANSKAAKKNFRGEKNKDESNAESSTTQNDEEAAMLKKKSRIILRNLSFYARENHIRKVMEATYGKVTDVHVPKVKNNLHVGFCFVTFEDPKDAQKAVDSKHVDIQKRAVKMDWSLPKKLHQQQKQQEQKQKQVLQQQKKTEASEENDDEDTSATSNSSDDSDSDGNSSNSDDSDSNSDSDDSDDEEHDENAMDEDNDSEDEEEEEPEDDAVGKKCCLFLRNLPFDTTRHDLFQLLYKFGHIKGIYLVKDRETGMLKGTAFVTYSKPQGAKRAMEFAATSSDSGGTPFMSQRQSVGRSNEGSDDASQIRGSLMLKGRKILVDMAVDKETAQTFDSKEYKIPQADRRNLYLQAEARVESSSADPNANNTDTWDDLPQQDQRKRQTALKDKTAKLQSPIFFINPNRLSFRNMGKHIDEAGLQKLIELATKRGLEKSLVGVEDQIAHWRALGEMTTRDILTKVQEIEGRDESVIPTWSYEDDSKDDETKSQRRKNIKDFIPSVYIDRDFGPNGKKADAPSRGFGFAEFTHHTHALACLRELNNNPAYSKDYAQGGKAADALKKKPHRKNKKGTSSNPADYRDDDGKVHVPRLIVDFVVENKVKAKKQAERRLHQQLNQSKQRLERLERKKAEKEAGETEQGGTKKKGRGALQREKKRKRRESGEEEAERLAKLQKKAIYEAKKELRKERAEEKKRRAEELKKKSVKPPKKKKSQLKKIEDDEEFESIVRSYQSKLESAREEKAPKSNPRESVKQKRWFD